VLLVAAAPVLGAPCWLPATPTPHARPEVQVAAAAELHVAS
jgi:hypothetical protein